MMPTIQATKPIRNNIIHAPVFIKQLPHSTRLTWLKAMADAGFPLIKLWGCSPRADLRLPFEKHGETQLRLRCLCYTGRKGVSCSNEGKHPVEGKDKNRSFKINYSHDIAKRTPLLNWGTPTGEQSGYIVIDIDAGKKGFENLQALLSSSTDGVAHTLPPTFTVLTGGGGKHLFFKHPGVDWHIKSLADHPELGIGIDVKGEGGYVVAAGSLHHSGNYYRPESNLLSAADITLADLPEWLLKKIGKLKSELPAQAAPLTPEQIKAMAAQFRRMKASGNSKGLEKWAESALQGECETVVSAPSHGNQTQVKAGFRIGGIVGAGLLNYTDALAALLDSANARGGKSSGPAARRSIENGLRAGMLHPRFPKPKDEEVKSALDIALEEWIAAGGKATSLITVLKPEYFEVVQDANDNWDEFDAVFGSTLDREHQLQQSDPEGYAKFCEEEAERQRTFDERRLKRSWSNKFGNNNATETHPTPNASPSHQPIPSYEPIWHRCHNCNAQNRHCEDCAKTKLGVTRPNPGTTICTRGKKLLLQSTVKGKEHILKKFHPKCGRPGCQICGFDYEADHLIHYLTFGEWFVDMLETPQLNVPSHRVEDLSTTKIDIQPGIWKVLVKDKFSRKYANKLSKMRGLVYYLADYIGNDTYAYYCILTPGFDPARLNYRPSHSLDDIGRVIDNPPLPPAEVTPEHISFKQFDAEHRLNISSHGRYIKLTRSLWELCDLPAGARTRHNGVSYCRALAMPKRFVSSGRNKLLGCIALDQDGEDEACQKFGTEFKEHDNRRIDKSHRRGLTQYLMKFGTYEFGEETPQSVLERFIARMLGKDRIITPASEDCPLFEPLHEEKGSICYSHPLVT